MIFGEFGDLIASVVGGGSTTYWCDYFYTNIGSNALRGVLSAVMRLLAIVRASVLRMRITPPRIRMRVSALGFVLFLNRETSLV